MRITKPLLGIFAVLGTWPAWESYFDLSRRGLKFSFAALAASLFPLWLVVYGVQTERARLADTADVLLPSTLTFALVVGLWLFSFPALAYLIGMIFEKMNRARPWVITRNWTVFFLTVVTGAMFGMVGLGVVPFMAANGVGLAAYLGLLAADIRLAQKVADFSWGTSALIGCVIVAVGMTFVVLALRA